MANCRGGYLKRPLVSTFTHTNALAHEMHTHARKIHACAHTCIHMEGRAVGSFQTLTHQQQMNCMITCYTDLQACEITLRPRSSYKGSIKTQTGMCPGDRPMEMWDGLISSRSFAEKRKGSDCGAKWTGAEWYWGGFAEETAVHPPSHLSLPGLPLKIHPEHKNFGEAVKCWAESRAGTTNLVPLEGNNKNPTRQKGSNHCLCHWSMPKHSCLVPTFTPWRSHWAARS